MNHNNINNFPPNINPQVFSWIAALIGSACVSDYTALEQNSIGNWLILVGQFILTNAAQQQLIEGRIENHNININSRQHKSGGSYYSSNNKSNQNQSEDIDFILKTLQNIEQELNKLKNK